MKRFAISVVAVVMIMYAVLRIGTNRHARILVHPYDCTRASGISKTFDPFSDSPRKTTPEPTSPKKA